jgi:hypothetical protein
MAAADQRRLIAKASIADITAKVENDLQETVRKLLQAHDVSAKTAHTALKEVGQVGDQTALLGDEEGTIQDERGLREDLQ